MRGARPDRALAILARRGLDGVSAAAPVLVAVSGGADSVGLALVLDAVARAGGRDLVVAHVDHGVRAQSGADAAVVLSVGARLGRRVAIRRLDVARDDEATLRDARYAVLTELAREHGAVAVATAHTAEDQTETVLLALFRGTGLDGLAGIPPVRPLAPGIVLVRPLLRATHADLLAAVRRAGFPYAIDPANAHLRYRRVEIRTALEPLRASFPGLDRAVARCAEHVRVARAGDRAATGSEGDR